MADSDKEEILHDVEQAAATNGKSGQTEDKVDAREVEQVALSTPFKKPIKLSKLDQKLLEIFSVDPEAYYTTLYSEFAKKLYQYLRKKASMQHSDSDIEDYVQITLTRFCNWAQNQQKISPATFQVNHNAYLHKTADHVLFDEAKKKKKLPTEYLSTPIMNQGEDTLITLADLLPDVHGIEEQEGKIFLDKVRDTIERLREPYRTVMHHIAVDGMTETEIIDHLHVNLNTGKSWVQRGRKMLKDALPEYKDHF